MDHALIARLSEIDLVVKNCKAENITIAEAAKEIKEIAAVMELIENGQRVITLDKE